ncbi:MAG: hypothetical protein KDA27_15485 [Candidatus Eisenbacteria bacterium]|uniref:T9SS type A sorting domain-containing protein n=1 Tax=Eiseniibacteriota bacterium TaxID=2212470 RepID=A0A956SE06_UNCEI|nr:hypothetical protein [Candidatus Eisenbacteria bacterium]MCB9464462.1 hypothetical protein [Candidatus Eisenbacteria bacterium]
MGPRMSRLSLVLLVPLLTAAPALAAPPTDGAWQQFPPPFGREGHSVFYDNLRDRLLLFGGSAWSEDTVSGSLWELPMSDNGQWRRIDLEGGPAPRTLHMWVYDSNQDRLILIGGEDNGQFFGDVWALHLSPSLTWEELEIAGPAPTPRAVAMTVFDPVSNRVVMHGGFDGSQRRDDLWELDLSGEPTWVELFPMGADPGPNSRHPGVYDPEQRRAVFFGGYDGADRNDTWALALDGAPVWTQLFPGGSVPFAMSRHEFVYDSNQDRAILYSASLFGGNGPNDSRLWSLSLGATPEWSDVSPTGLRPFGRRYPGVAFDSTRNRLILTHGLILNDTWTLDFDDPLAWSEWTPPGGPLPKAIEGASLIYDTDDDRMIAFGGVGPLLDQTGETWQVNALGTYEPFQLFPGGDPPSPRYEHSAVYDTSRDRMIVFGGYGTGYLNDTWAMDLEASPTWAQLLPDGTAPSGRQAASAIYDPTADRILLFGGRSGSTINADLWELSLEATPTWTEITTAGTGPGPRSDHVAALDPNRNRMILFGGRDGNGTWALELEPTLTWTELIVTGSPPPGGLTRSAMTYDPDMDRMLLFGGFEGSLSTNAVWELTLGSTPEWRVLSPEGHVSPGFNNHSAAVRTSTGEVLVFAGNGNTASIYRPSTSSAVEDNPRVQTHLGLRILPNPMSRSATVEFRIDRAGEVRIDAIDVSGRNVGEIFQGTLSAGRHQLSLDDRLSNLGLAPGTYWLRVRSERGEETVRTTVVK